MAQEPELPASIQRALRLTDASTRLECACARLVQSVLADAAAGRDVPVYKVDAIAEPPGVVSLADIKWFQQLHTDITREVAFRLAAARAAHAAPARVPQRWRWSKLFKPAA